jgi:hypothetical protein
MRLNTLLVCSAALVLVPAVRAQRWEFGGAVGGGFYTSQSASSPAGSADAKFVTGVVGSAWLGNTRSGRWGGELRYDFQQGDMQLKSSGTTVNFGAQTHAVHYDFLLYTAPAEARVRPFLAVGAGVKVYRGTGTEREFQPLGDIALLTKTQDVRALVSIGAGIKFHVSPGLNFRVEVHDQMTPFPDEVIAPALNAKVGGWLHDIIPMFGLSFVF